MKETLMAASTNYDSIASFYDRHWTDRYQPQALEVLSGVLLPNLLPGSSILDVGCGTGIIAQELVNQGYKVVGIDISAEMLKCAQKRIPGGAFIVADARSYGFQCRFNAAISLFDTLNHILSSGEMLTVFRNVYGALAPSGVFVFDLNMEEAYQTQWDKSSAHVYPDEVCIVRGGYDRQTRLGHTEIITFSSSASGWQRRDVFLRQRCYPEDEIRQLLRLAGFQRTQTNTAAELGMRDKDLAAGRSFFTAQV
jgi:SAM-dependent methyltransferase